MEAYQGRKHCVFWGKKEKEEENEVQEMLLVLVCGGVHGKVMEKNEAWNGVVCSK